MQYIVHIGVNKTGTSSLQRAFSNARGDLRARRNSHLLVMSLDPNQEKGYLTFDRFARISYARYGRVERASLKATTPGVAAAALMQTIEITQEQA